MKKTISLVKRDASLKGSPYAGVREESFFRVLMMERKDVARGQDAMEEEEPGYLHGLLEGLKYFNTTLGEGITVKWFESMHDVMAQHIRTGTYPDGIPQNFRNDPLISEAFGFVRGETFTEDGFKELCDRYKTLKDDEGDAVLKFLLKNPREFAQWEAPKENKVFDSLIDSYGLSSKEILTDTRKIKYIVSSEDLEVSAEELSSYVQSTKCFKTPRLIQKPLRRDTAIWAFTFFHDRYKSEIDAAKSDEKKLEAIVSFCQNLEQIHLFADGNVRTIGIFLLNKCLWENNLLPTSLNDVNCLDGFSRSELMGAVKEGQDYFAYVLSF